MPQDIVNGFHTQFDCPPTKKKVKRKQRVISDIEHYTHMQNRRRRNPEIRCHSWADKRNLVRIFGSFSHMGSVFRFCDLRQRLATLLLPGYCAWQYEVATRFRGRRKRGGGALQLWPAWSFFCQDWFRSVLFTACLCVCLCQRCVAGLILRFCATHIRYCGLELRVLPVVVLSSNSTSATAALLVGRCTTGQNCFSNHRLSTYLVAAFGCSIRFPAALCSSVTLLFWWQGAQGWRFSLV